MRVGPVEVARVDCDGGARVTPARDGVPPLPWDLQVIRLRDGSVILEATVAELPRFLFQMGDEIGLGMSPVAGPPGPTCPAA